MAASKQANKQTHARAQCSHANVGLAQARPNHFSIFVGTLDLSCMNSINTRHFTVVFFFFVLIWLQTRHLQAAA